MLTVVKNTNTNKSNINSSITKENIKQVTNIIKPPLEDDGWLPIQFLARLPGCRMVVSTNENHQHFVIEVTVGNRSRMAYVSGNLGQAKDMAISISEQMLPEDEDEDECSFDGFESW